jgi:hypothetical protein
MVLNGNYGIILDIVKNLDQIQLQLRLQLDYEASKIFQVVAAFAVGYRNLKLVYL